MIKRTAIVVVVFLVAGWANSIVIIPDEAGELKTAEITESDEYLKSTVKRRQVSEVAKESTSTFKRDEMWQIEETQQVVKDIDQRLNDILEYAKLMSARKRVENARTKQKVSIP